MPDVTVVIPARDAASTLPRTLDALQAQTLAPERFEVVVVDDRSTDATAGLAEEHPRVDRVIRLGDRAATGPGAARNTAARATSADVLAFTDADCFAEPAWLQEGLAALSDADLVQGRVIPERPPGPYDRTVHVTGLHGLFETANLLVRSDLFHRLGGFEPGWTPQGGKELGEDTWLGWRARRHGARIAFAPQATVRHAVFPRTRGAYIAERRRLSAFPAIVDRVPELRSTLCWRRPFLTRRGAAFDAAALGVLTAVIFRRPAPLALALPYLAERPRPAETAADAVGAAALLSGSFRARSLLL